MVTLTGWLFPYESRATETPLKAQLIFSKDKTPLSYKIAGPYPKELKKTKKKSIKIPNTPFYYGYCTYYVDQKVDVPWNGNANQWINKAKSLGYKVDKIPQVGSIVQSNESRYGHVSFIEAVNGNLITVSEMNYIGWNKKSTRTIDINSSIIKGIIHI